MSPDTSVSFVPLAYRSAETPTATTPDDGDTFVPAPVATDAPTTESATGYSAGYAAGWAAGTRAAARAAAVEQRRAAEAEAVRSARRVGDAEAALAVLSRAADAARERPSPVLTEATDTLVRAAVELAEALLGAELSDGPTAARTALARALAEPHGSEVVRVRLHPADVELIRTALPEVTVPGSVELVADATLERGDAVSELEAGYVDARLSTAVVRARTALEVDR